jgi:RimJ/RimL family protein N-acetyltransferase
VIEIGHILWSPLIAKTRMATESIYLMLRYAFDELRYRRVEWKCDNNNAASKRAAERFGFTHEGVFRRHLIVKGLNRDTAWFAIIDEDWPRICQCFQRWLEESNFDEFGIQKQKLSYFFDKNN